MLPTVTSEEVVIAVVEVVVVAVVEAVVVVVVAVVQEQALNEEAAHLHAFVLLLITFPKQTT